MRQTLILFWCARRGDTNLGHTRGKGRRCDQRAAREIRAGYLSKPTDGLVDDVLESILLAKLRVVIPLPLRGLDEPLVQSGPEDCLSESREGVLMDVGRVVRYVG